MSEKEIKQKEYVNQLKKQIKLLESELEQTRAVINDIYPTLAGRVIQLQEAGEEKAVKEWDAVCRKVLAVLKIECCTT